MKILKKRKKEEKVAGGTKKGDTYHRDSVNPDNVGFGGGTHPPAELLELQKRRKKA